MFHSTAVDYTLMEPDLPLGDADYDDSEPAMTGDTTMVCKLYSGSWNMCTSERGLLSYSVFHTFICLH